VSGFGFFESIFSRQKVNYKLQRFQRNKFSLHFPKGHFVKKHFTFQRSRTPRFQIFHFKRFFIFISVSPRAILLFCFFLKVKLQGNGDPLLFKFFFFCSSSSQKNGKREKRKISSEIKVLKKWCEFLFVQVKSESNLRG